MFNHFKKILQSIYFVYSHGPEIVLRDTSTGVLTKTVFIAMALKAIQQSARSNQPISVLIADMDNLKKINDTNGHKSGDDYLRMSAKIMQDTLRSSDILGRYGGDEFIALLPGTNKASALLVQDKLQKALDAKSMHWSIGASEAIFPPDINLLHKSFSREDWNVFLNNLIESADKELYKNKINKKNQ